MAVSSIRNNVSQKKSLKHNRYVKISLILSFTVLISGWLINEWMVRQSTPEVITTSIQPPINNDLDTMFKAAVSHMQNAQYQQAVELWHQILLKNPSIPEVNVNIGFSLYELGQFSQARDFFITAMEQNSFQSNAYYGLAISSEKMGDLEGALGAMKSYIHLAQNSEDQPYIRKARAALWEWEEQLKISQPRQQSTAKK